MNLLGIPGTRSLIRIHSTRAAREPARNAKRLRDAGASETPSTQAGSAAGALEPGKSRTAAK